MPYIALLHSHCLVKGTPIPTNLLMCMRRRELQHEWQFRSLKIGAFPPENGTSTHNTWSDCVKYLAVGFPHPRSLDSAPSGCSGHTNPSHCIDMGPSAMSYEQLVSPTGLVQQRPREGPNGPESVLIVGNVSLRRSTWHATFDHTQRNGQFWCDQCGNDPSRKHPAGLDTNTVHGLVASPFSGSWP